MDAKVTGNTTPALAMELSPGDNLFAQSGAMLYMTGDVEMNVEMKGGLLGGLKRKVLSGESLFLTTFEAGSGGGSLGLAAPYPGSIRQIELNGTNEILAERGAFLAASGDVNIESAFKMKLAGFLGGEGFLLQKLTGRGTAWVHGGGDFIEFDLQPGQELRVDTGCLVYFDSTVKYDIQKTGGVKKMLFSGEGLFLANMTGPGKVVVQTMPFGKMAQAIIGGAVTNAESGGVTGALGNIGGLLGN